MLLLLLKNHDSFLERGVWGELVVGLRYSGKTSFQRMVFISLYLYRAHIPILILLSPVGHPLNHQKSIVLSLILLFQHKISYLAFGLTCFNEILLSNLLWWWRQWHDTGTFNSLDNFIKFWINLTKANQYKFLPLWNKTFLSYLKLGI